MLQESRRNMFVEEERPQKGRTEGSRDLPTHNANRGERGSVIRGHTVECMFSVAKH